MRAAFSIATGLLMLIGSASAMEKSPVSHEILWSEDCLPFCEDGTVSLHQYGSNTCGAIALLNAFQLQCGEPFDVRGWDYPADWIWLWGIPPSTLTDHANTLYRSDAFCPNGRWVNARVSEYQSYVSTLRDWVRDGRNPKGVLALISSGAKKLHWVMIQSIVYPGEDDCHVVYLESDQRVAMACDRFTELADDAYLRPLFSNRQVIVFVENRRY